MDFFSKFRQKNFWLVRTIVLSKFQRTLPLIGAPSRKLNPDSDPYLSLDLLKSKGRPLSYTPLPLSSFFFIFFSIFFQNRLPTPDQLCALAPPRPNVKRPRIKPSTAYIVKLFFLIFFQLCRKIILRFLFAALHRARPAASIPALSPAKENIAAPFAFALPRVFHFSWPLPSHLSDTYL